MGLIAEKLARFKAGELGELLELSLVSGMNCLIASPGGTGKSMMTEWLFNQMGIKPFVQACNSEVTVSKLYGGLDLAALQKGEGENFLLNKSFANHRAVIFEEFLDLHPDSFEALKDCLMSGYVRNGSQQFKVKTQYVFAVTNIDKNDYIESVSVERANSIKAVLDRFPLYLKYDPDILDDFWGWAACLGRDKDEDPFSEEFLETLKVKAKKLMEEEIHRLQLSSPSNASKALHVTIEKIKARWGTRYQPRHIYQAIKIMAASAAIHGRNAVAVEDLKALKFLFTQNDNSELIGSTVADMGLDLDMLQNIQIRMDAYKGILNQMTKVKFEDKNTLENVCNFQLRKDLREIKEMGSELSGSTSRDHVLTWVANEMAAVDAMIAKFRK